MKKVLVPLLSLLLALIFLPCQAAENEFEELKAQQVKELLDSGQEMALLNGVSDIMYNQGFIPGSLNVVLEQIPTSELMPKNLDTLIVSYCMGRRWWIHLDTARSAVARGYTNVKVFTDGIPGWVKAGYPLDTSRSVPKLNIPTITWNQLQAAGDTVTVFELTRPRTRKTIGYIPGAINIPMQELSHRVGEISKDKPVIVVDYNGKQYQHAGSWLMANGYKDVKALSGGLIEAVRKGAKLPLEK